MAKDLLKEAIADAKAVREVALQNAKLALEEAFDSKLKSMFSAKLAEELEEEELEEEFDGPEFEDDDEAYMSATDDLGLDDESVLPDYEEYYDLEDFSEGEMYEEEIDLEELMAELASLEEEDDDEYMEEAKDKDDESMEEAKMKKAKDELDENFDIDALIAEIESSLEEVKEVYFNAQGNLDPSFVKFVKIVAPFMYRAGINDPMMLEVVDWDSLFTQWADFGALERFTQEEILDFAKRANVSPSDINYIMSLPEVSLLDKEISSKEISSYQKNLLNSRGGNNLFEKKNKKDKDKEAMEKKLKEAMDTILSLRESISEMNLLNSKLLYCNKLFKENHLTDSQKLKIVESLDGASTPKEAKLVYNTLKESFTMSGIEKRSIKEGLGLSSKPVAKQVLTESVDQTILRFQKLANIKP